MMSDVPTQEEVETYRRVGAWLAQGHEIPYAKMVAFMERRGWAVAVQGEGDVIGGHMSFVAMTHPTKRKFMIQVWNRMVTGGGGSPSATVGLIAKRTGVREEDVLREMMEVGDED